jgi:glycyl-tRNA synthetase
VSVAFTADAAPTAAATGFARSNGIPVEELERLTVDGIEYLAARRHEPGRPAAEALAPMLSSVVTGLRSARNMRWRDPQLSFTRPIRWLLALLDTQVVAVTAGSLTAGRTTRVHRTLPSPLVEIPDADAYAQAMRRSGILVDQRERREAIEAMAVRLAAEVGGQINLDAEDGLVNEITYLVEQPVAVLGGFESRYLELPEAVLTTVMRKHQRYLPVRGEDGRLLPYFVTIANGVIDVDVVRAGNEAVLRARFEDAAFFYRADLATPLADLRARLARLTFTDKLGSIAERADRIAALADELAAEVPHDDAQNATLRRAARLVKVDLGAQLVVELTSLAGTMAREYALAAGETPEVAQALLDCELPRTGGGTLPATVPGALLSLADRLDALVGLAATVGLPTGSSDPFAVRRTALGVLAVLRGTPALAGIDLDRAAVRAAAGQPVPVDADTLDAVGRFLTRRLEQQLTDEGQPVDRIRALRGHAARPRLVDQLLVQLDEFADRADFRALAAALQRARRIVPAGTPAEYDPAVLCEPAEHQLHEAVKSVRADLDDRVDLSWFTARAGRLADPVGRFFDEILVMTDDPRLRAARLGLLAVIRDLGDRQLDWAELRL